MAKKNFQTGINHLISDSRQTIDKSQKKERREVASDTQKATYYYNTETLNSIKSIAFFDRKYIGEVIDEALNLYISEYKDLQKAKKEYKTRHI